MKVITVYCEPQWLSPRTRNHNRHNPWTVIVKTGDMAVYHRFAEEGAARTFASEQEEAA